MEDQTTEVYLLISGDEPESEPVAAFSSHNLIESLAEYFNKFVEGGVIVKAVPSNENTLPVDKYARLVEIGMAPFYVLLNPDGKPFGPADLLARSWEEDMLEVAYDWVVKMQEAEQDDPNKQWLIGGVFWAPNQELAIQRAIMQHQIILATIENAQKSQEDSKR